MTKPLEAHRDEIVRLYMDENKTLEVVMDLMRARHRFTASRRCYMDNLRKWGVRKHKRKTVVVHNPPPDDATGVGQPPAQPGRQLGPSSSSSSSTAQSLVLPGPAQPGQLQDWPCFPLDGWPVEPPSVPGYDAAAAAAAAPFAGDCAAPQPPALPARYLTAHRPQLGGGADQHVSAPPDGGDPFLEQYLFRWDFSRNGLC